MKNGSNKVILTADLGEFFRDKLGSARSGLGLELDELTEYYLVQLLCEFSRRAETGAVQDEALALLYKRALEADLLERLKLLKSLGDLALYVAGFFREAIERSPVDRDYYVSMGGCAYGDLSSLIGARRHNDQFATLFAGLAKQFADLVELLNAVADQAREGAQGDRDLVRLYERWLRTGDERLRQQLAAAGLIAGDGDDKVH